IERRFGPHLRSLAAGLFLMTRAAAEGVRVFAVSIVVAIAIGTGEIASIAIITLLTLIYTFEGGMAAVIWTDVIQMIIYIGGTAVGFITLLRLVPGGWGTIHAAAAAAGKLRIFDFTPTFSRTYTFWAGLIGGTFLTTASHGTDQLMVQRLLSAKNKAQSQGALLASGVFILVQFALFLLVGAALFVFYHHFPPATPFTRSDRIFPTFIVLDMPRGISGLLIAAILAAAMSNLSAALNSLSSSSIWALVLFALAILSQRGGRVVEVGLSIASVAYGAMLGIFLLGLLTKRANERGAMVGMACGFAVELYIWLGTQVPWTWYVVIGTAVTFTIGYIASSLAEKPAS